MLLLYHEFDLKDMIVSYIKEQRPFFYHGKETTALLRVSYKICQSNLSVIKIWIQFEIINK